MKTHAPTLIAAGPLALLLALLPPTPALAQEGARDPLQTQQELNIRILNGQIQALQQRRAANERAAVAEADRLEREILRMEEACRRDRQDLGDEQAQQQDIRKRIRLAKAQESHHRETIRAAATIVTEAAETSRQRIADGIPFEKTERIGKLESVADNLDARDELATANVILSFFSFLGEELSLAGAVDVWNAPIAPAGDGREIHAYQVRLGLAHQFFIAEDRKEVGVFCRQSANGWEQELPESSVRQLLVALDILQNRRAIDLVDIPWLTPDTADEGEKDASK